MELIDRNEIYERFFNGGPGVARIHISDIDAIPTIDPIRAAGGCRCGECKHYGPGPFGYGCHTMFDGKAAVIPHNPEHFCGDGEPKEMKNDG